MDQSETTPAATPAPQPEKSVQPAAPVSVGIPENHELASLERNARYWLESGYLPKGIDSVAKVVVCVQKGLEVGLSPLQAIEGSAVINGKHSFDVLTCQAISEQHGLIDVKEHIDEQGHARAVVTRLYPNGDRVQYTGEFSMEDAERAGLLGKDNWKRYPKDMLMWKAKARALRLGFAGALKGIKMTEDLDDEPPTVARRLPSMIDTVNESNDSP